jgi:pyridinium-3,5-bisthiocarboxylic acid mononucleotide nickel chelatase
MRVAYVHGFAGVSGTGLLAALLEAGAPLAGVQAGWHALQLPALQVSRDSIQLPEYTATRLVYTLPAPGDMLPSRSTFADLMGRIEQSTTSARVRQLLQQLLGRFAEAVARVYRVQEYDVVCRSPFLPAVLYMGSGVCLALEALAIEQLMSAPVNLGAGPHPVTAEIVRHVPVYGTAGSAGLTTVDGAAILTTVAAGFGPLPAMSITGTQYGVTPEPSADTMHGVQVLFGETDAAPAVDRIAVLETNIDDMNPEFYEVVFERLFAAGALDVTLTPLFMKKGRPANTLTVLAPLAAVSRLSRLILQETSTFGVRIYEAWRQKLERFSRPVETCYGIIPVKCGILDGRIVQAAPEYEACKRAALAQGVPVRLVYSEAARLAASWLSTTHG